LDAKLKRIRELIDLKERTDGELARLLGESEAPRRGRPPKQPPADAPESAHAETTE
jgi:hypothetical protein